MIISKTLVVVGGGAAGFFCAINAARLNPSLKVIILEKSPKVLSKVKVSGGERCNVTNHTLDIDTMAQNYPRGERFLKKAFHWFSVKDTIAWFNERGVSLKTEKDGRMFPTSNNSQTIINCLLQEASKYNIDVRLQSSVLSILKKNDKFELILDHNKESIISECVCITTGGFPKPEQWSWLTVSGHSIEPPVPSLFTFNIPNHSITSLMGISVPHASIKLNESKLRTEGPILITHWGLSGPAVLKLSSLAARELASKKYQFEIWINWTGNDHEQMVAAKLQEFKTKNVSQKIFSHMPYSMPGRLWQFLTSEAEMNENTRWPDISTKQINKLSQILSRYTMHVKGKTTFKEEFVTCGGIKLNEVDVNTMQSKIVPNLFFAGEVLDIDGVTGGFNFQNAWTTGWIAAKAVAQN